MALDLEAVTVTFAPGSTVSSVGKLGVKALVGIFFPAAFVAGAVQFNVSPVNDGVNFYPFWDAAGAARVSVVATAAAPNQFVAISNTNQWAAVNMVQLVATVTQTAGCTVTLLVRSVAF